tara:strand:- start:291 stop:650 length:360 start_codon:yes stop_codon:yes gene_type:complete
MKNFIIANIFLYSFSVAAENYYCNYNEFETNKIIIFDRVTHSHFKICDEKSCDKNRYVVIYADEDNLIFGNVDFKKEMEKRRFELIMIDKREKLFTAAKISLPKSNIKNEFIKGQCVFN